MLYGHRKYFPGRLFTSQAYLQGLSTHRQAYRASVDPISRSRSTTFLAQKYHRLSCSLGIESPRGLFIPMIHNGSRIPVACSNVFTSTSSPSGTERIQVLQGVNALARHNRKLGSLDLVFARTQTPLEVSLTFSMNDATTLHISAYDTTSPTSTQTTSLLVDAHIGRDKLVERCDEGEELRFIEAKEQADITLRIIKEVFLEKEEVLKDVPSISSCYDKLEAILQTNDFSASSAINDHILALRNATMQHFEQSHYRRYRLSPGQSTLSDLDPRLPLF